MPEKQIAGEFPALRSGLRPVLSHPLVGGDELIRAVTGGAAPRRIEAGGKGLQTALLSFLRCAASASFHRARLSGSLRERTSAVLRLREEGQSPPVRIRNHTMQVDVMTRRFYARSSCRNEACRHTKQVESEEDREAHCQKAVTSGTSTVTSPDISAHE